MNPRDIPGHDALTIVARLRAMARREFRRAANATRGVDPRENYARGGALEAAAAIVADAADIDATEVIPNDESWGHPGGDSP